MRRTLTVRIPVRWLTVGLVILLIGALIPTAFAVGGRFIDDDTSMFEADIEWLAEAEVTRGCNPSEGNTRFCPEDEVTRGQMAAFMRRFARFLGAEDGTVNGADWAAVAETAVIAEEAVHAQSADTAGHADTASSAVSADAAKTAQDADTVDGVHADDLQSILMVSQTYDDTTLGTYFADVVPYIVLGNFGAYGLPRLLTGSVAVQVTGSAAQVSCAFTDAAGTGIGLAMTQDMAPGVHTMTISAGYTGSGFGWVSLECRKTGSGSATATAATLQVLAVP
jgi:hypothetical protein